MVYNSLGLSAGMAGSYIVGNFTSSSAIGMDFWLLLSELHTNFKILSDASHICQLIDKCSKNVANAMEMEVHPTASWFPPVSVGGRGNESSRASRHQFLWSPPLTKAITTRLQVPTRIARRRKKQSRPVAMFCFVYREHGMNCVIRPTATDQRKARECKVERGR